MKSALRHAFLVILLSNLSGLVGCDTDDTDDPTDSTTDAVGDSSDVGGDTTCLAMPVCDSGEQQVDSESDCLQDDAVCYSNSMCGVTIWCTGEDAPELRFLSGGFQSGECMGACGFDIALVDSELTLIIISDAGVTLHEATATITETGGAALEQTLGVLSDATLDEVYGCPDCLDGGETHATLLRGADESDHRWESGNPPTELEDLDTFIRDSIGDIIDCTSSEALTQAANCDPWEEL